MKKNGQKVNGLKIPRGVIDDLEKSKRSKPKDDRHSWYEMNWLVEFSKKDLEKLRPGDLLNLQQEFLGYEDASLFEPKVSPTLDELRVTQRVVAKHLQELFERGYTKLGPFEREVHIIRPREDMFPDLPALLESHWKGQETVELMSVVIETDTDKQHPRLLYKFVTLLKKYVDAVSRCPHCSTIFLRFKRNSTYCGRKCQSVAFMRLKRAQGDGGTRKKLGRKPKRRSAHGQTKR